MKLKGARFYLEIKTWMRVLLNIIQNAAILFYEKGALSQTMKQVVLPLYTEDECKKVYRSREDIVCAGGIEGEGPQL